MNNNYIEFLYDQNDKYIAKVHKDRGIYTIRENNSMKKLKELLAKKSIYLHGQVGKIDNVDDVIDNFFKYIKSPLKVLNQITQDMHLSKVNKALGKTVVATTLATIIGATSIGVVNASKKEDDVVVPNEQIVYIEEDNSFEEPILPVVEEQSNKKADELDQMIINNASMDEFHFSYEDRSNLYTLDKARRYEDIFEKYARMYGLDKELLIAMGAQENYGEHYENLHNHGSTGMMRIEDVNLDTDIKAYNFETGEMEKFHITLDKIKDLDTNIKVGAMMLRSKIDSFDNNLPLAIQSYNYGNGNVSKVLNLCAEKEGINKDDIKSNPLYQNWMKYRKDAVKNGDPVYLERIFSYLPSGYELNIKSRDGNDISMRIINDNVKTNQM